MAIDLPPEGQDKPDADAFGRALANGLGVNLLVSDVQAAARFQATVLEAEISYWDQDFAIVQAAGTTWMLHRDRTYRNHPLMGIAQGAEGRGAGVELRIYGRDPDAACAAAEALGAHVMVGPQDKPHGLREAYILDNDGYLWVPSVPKK